MCVQTTRIDLCSFLASAITRNSESTILSFQFARYVPKF